MEAFACGTPVIAYPSGALADIVQEATGFLVRRGKKWPIRSARSLHKSNVAGQESGLFSNCGSSRTRSGRYMRPTSASTEGVTVEGSGFREELLQNEPEWRVFSTAALGAPVSVPGLAENRGGSSSVRPNSTVWQFGAIADSLALAACFRYDGKLVFIGNGITDQQDILAGVPSGCCWLTASCGRVRLDLQEIPEGSPLLRDFPSEPSRCRPCSN